MTHMCQLHTWVNNTHEWRTHMSQWHTWVNDTHECTTHTSEQHTWLQGSRKTRSSFTTKWMQFRIILRIKLISSNISNKVDWWLQGSRKTRSNFTTKWMRFRIQLRRRCVTWWVAVCCSGSVWQRVAMCCTVLLTHGYRAEGRHDQVLQRNGCDFE